MSGDDALLAAEERLAALQAEARAVYAEHPNITMEQEEELVCEVFDVEEHALLDLIDETAPRTLAGAAVKLRALADHGCLGDAATAALRQVLALIEGLARSGEVGFGPAPPHQELDHG